MKCFAAVDFFAAAIQSYLHDLRETSYFLVPFYQTFKCHNLSLTDTETLCIRTSVSIEEGNNFLKRIFQNLQVALWTQLKDINLNT